MPTYAYRCADCGHAFDIHQAFTDDTLTECPECGGSLRKVFASVGVTFKGSGFYRNDSRGAKSSSTTGASASSTSGSSGTSSSPAPSTSSSSGSSSGSTSSGSSSSGGSKTGGSKAASA
ncbi:FmdB family transcriptional regulator [Antribacter sp. KLBMP9083]|uniref:FmdB family transcriptional regulator n=1 Tax=Antribacter soli TaxID=2910976 RepID=A0AA41QAU0_9MICO|nr:FmdB family zinc ribbon protein [Antribacter soli]MCF4119858.1 FmdB family transcriptional regulator [Antribacter soli]